MNRISKAGLCAVTLCVASHASAATIVQTASSSNGPTFVNSFNTNLGTLNSVTVESMFFVNRFFRYFSPDNVAPIVNVTGRLGSTGLGFADISGAYQSNGDGQTISVRLRGTASEVTTSGFGQFTGGSVFLGGDLIDATFSAVGGRSLEPAIVSFPGQSGGSFRVTYDYTVAPFVPEPTTWALMLAGFGMVGYAMRRRRPKVVFA